MRKPKSPWKGLLKGLLLPAAAAVVLLFFGAALDSLDSGREAEGLRQLEDALYRGCVACYATEGAYPPTLEYLKEHYGVQVDEERYVVYYEIFAENLIPNITILEKKP